MYPRLERDRNERDGWLVVCWRCRNGPLSGDFIVSRSWTATCGAGQTLKSRGRRKSSEVVDPGRDFVQPGQDPVFAADTPTDPSDVSMLLTTDIISGADLLTATPASTRDGRQRCLFGKPSAVRSRHGRAVAAPAATTSDPRVSSCSARCVRRGDAEQGEVALEVGVMSLVEDHLRPTNSSPSKTSRKTTWPAPTRRRRRR